MKRKLFNLLFTFIFAVILIRIFFLSITKFGVALGAIISAIINLGIDCLLFSMLVSGMED